MFSQNLFGLEFPVQGLFWPKRSNWVYLDIDEKLRADLDLYPEKMYL